MIRPTSQLNLESDFMASAVTSCEPQNQTELSHTPAHHYTFCLDMKSSQDDKDLHKNISVP